MKKDRSKKTHQPILKAASFLAVFYLTLVPIHLFGEISDGAHGGNEHFYFLSPLVPEPFPAGIFDGNETPVVEICEWTGTECVLPLVARFAASSGPGSETVRVDPEELYYIANWHTDLFDLDLAKIYRIRVLFESQEPIPIVQELGFADVKFRSGGKPPRDIGIGEYASIRQGRTVPITFLIEEGFCAVCELNPTDRSKISPVLIEQFVEEDPIEPVEALVNIHDDQIPLGDHSGIQVIRDYSPTLPYAFILISSSDALSLLAEEANTKWVFDNLPFELLGDPRWQQDRIGQPLAQRNGYTGAGTAVGVVDTGIEPELLDDPAFGECTEVGSPACCSVVVNESLFSGGLGDVNHHGLKVSQIVADVAPGTDIVSLDVTIGRTQKSNPEQIVAGADWVLNHVNEYNFVAVNISMGDYKEGGRGWQYSEDECPSYVDDVFKGLRAKGIMPIAASGNDGGAQPEDGYLGVTWPACSRWAVSVGASTSADEVYGGTTRGPNLDLLASSGCKTSCAAPVVAGAWALMREAQPEWTLDQTLDHLKATAVLIEDPVSGLTFRRVDVAAALGINQAMEDYRENFDQLGSELATGDFNGDGFDDVAIGVPGETGFYNSGWRYRNPGAVNVLYGGPGGLDFKGSQFLRLGPPGEPYYWDSSEDPYWQTGFGAALAVGDFDGDGFSDLAVGAPGVTIETINGDLQSDHSGVVKVFYGSPDGLSTSRTQAWDESDTVCYGSPPGTICIPLPTSEAFGASLAAADFNGDGQDDLAVGVPEADIGESDNAGKLYVLYGILGEGLSEGGFRGQAFSQADVLNLPFKTNAQFGYSLAAGDINSDGYHDLAIGAPSTLVSGEENAGLVNILYGSEPSISLPFGGLSTEGSQFIHKGQWGTLHSNQRFGYALSFGSITGEYDDLFVGSMEEPSASGPQGVVFMLSGSAQGFQVSPTLVFESLDASSEFSLATGNFDSNAYGDFAVGIPAGRVDGEPSSGRVSVITILGFSVGELELHQDIPWLEESAEGVDFFGAAIAVGDFNADGKDDLVVGVPGESYTAEAGSYRDSCQPPEWKNAGLIHVVYGGGPEILSTLSDKFRQGVN